MRHRQTKEAETDRSELTNDSPALYSTLMFVNEKTLLFMGLHSKLKALS